MQHCFASEEPYVHDMTHVRREELRNELDAADTDAVRMFDSDSMTVGLKRYGEETARGKGSRKHTEDELYYVLDGTGKMKVGDEIHPVAAGDLLYVPQGESHDIVQIDREITVLKIFRD